MKRNKESIKKHDFLTIKKRLDFLYHKSSAFTAGEKVEYFEVMKVLKIHSRNYLITKFSSILFLFLLCNFWVDLQSNSTLILNYRGNEIFLISKYLDLMSFDLSVLLNAIFICSVLLIVYFIDYHLENIFTIKFIKKIIHDPILGKYTMLDHCSDVIPKDGEGLNWRHRFED